MTWIHDALAAGGGSDLDLAVDRFASPSAGREAERAARDRYDADPDWQEVGGGLR